MVSRSTEDSIFDRVVAWLRRFLDRVRDLISAAFRRFGTTPDPYTVFEASPLWNMAVDDLMSAFGRVAKEWRDDPVVVASLDMTRNLIKGVPDDVHRIIVNQVVAGTALGETPEQLTARVDRVLSVQGQDRWTGRARAIAATESSRTWNAGLYASGLNIQQRVGRAMSKTWLSHHDDRVRDSHLHADGQTVRLSQPFRVGNALLMFPGDASGPAEEICSCRCSLRIAAAQ